MTHATPSSDTLRKYVVTGGAGCGKTTVIEELARRGFATVPEAAMRAIDALNNLLGIDRQRAWRKAHGEAFQSLLVPLHLRHESEALCAARGAVFLDRGVLDGVAYCDGFGIPKPAELMDMEAAPPDYSAVFILDLPPRNLYADRDHTGRADDYDAATRIAALLANIYTRMNYPVHAVPFAPLEERVTRILRVVEAR